MSKKILALALALVMVCSLCLTPALAAADAPSKTFPDAENNWAESSINRWGAAGVVTGDTEGNFNPGKYLSRAELATVLVRLLGLSETAPADTFSDVSANAWYADAVLKNAAAKIMLGDGKGKAMPEQNVTREQAITMIGRALGAKGGSEADLAKFSDAAQVANWSEPFAAAFTAMGILNGVEDGSRVAPQLPIDRASAMALLDKAIASYITTPGDYTVNAENKFVVVNVPGGGNVTVRGTAAGILVTPGNTANVSLKGVNADTLKIDAPVEVNLDNKTSIDTVTVAAGAAKGDKTPTVNNRGDINNLVANDNMTLTGKKPANTTVADGVTVNGSTSSGSTGGGGRPNRPSTAEYDVTVKTAGNAADKITVGLKGLTATNGVYSVEEDAEVEVVVTIAEGADVTYTVSVDAEGVEVKDNKFTMPAQNVTVTVEATEKTPDVPDEVKKDDLKAAIDAAQKVADDKNITVNEGPAANVDKGVKFVTAAEKKALTDAIAAAQKAFDNANATQAEVDEAVKTLNAAVEAFNKAVKTGEKEAPKPVEVDKTELTKALTAAADAKKDVTVNEGAEADVDRGVKFVNQATMNALDAAIKAAQAVADNANATQDEVNKAAADLNKAVEDFTKAVKTGTKTDKPEPKPETYTVTLDVKPAGAAVTATLKDLTADENGKYTVEDGTEVELVLTYDAKVYEVSVDVNGVKLDGAKFTVTKNTTVVITAKVIEKPEEPKDEYTVTLDTVGNVAATLKGEGITNEGNVYTVKADTLVTLVLTYNKDLYTVSVDAEGVTVSANNNFTMPAKNVTITVTATEIEKPEEPKDETYTVTLDADPNVGVEIVAGVTDNGDGTYEVKADTVITLVYTIAADANLYTISADVSNPYKVTGNVTIHATAVAKPILTLVNNTTAKVELKADGIYDIGNDTYAIAADTVVTVVVNDGSGAYTITADTQTIANGGTFTITKDVTLTVVEEDKKNNG